MNTQNMNSYTISYTNKYNADYCQLLVMAGSCKWLRAAASDLGCCSAASEAGSGEWWTAGSGEWLSQLQVTRA